VVKAKSKLENGEASLAEQEEGEGTLHWTDVEDRR